MISNISINGEKTMKLKAKILIVFLVGVLLLVSMGSFYRWFNGFTTKRSQIQLTIATLESYERALDGEVLSSTYSLYGDQDALIRSVKPLQSTLNTLNDNPDFRADYPKSAEALTHYQALLDTKIAALYRFQSVNAAIKNATAIVGLLPSNALDLFSTHNENENVFLHSLIHLCSDIFITRGGLDATLVQESSQRIMDTPCSSFSTQGQRDLCDTAQRNTRLIRENLPSYIGEITHLTHGGTYEALARLRNTFALENQTLKARTQEYTLGLGIFYLLALGLIIGMFVSSENRTRTDTLTHLGNRKKYKELIGSKRYQELVLVNIDRFKNYNDIYGIDMGDSLLRAVAQTLRLICAPYSKRISLVRFGSDEFGLLLPISLVSHPTLIVEEIINYFETHSLLVGEMEISISVTIATSHYEPLLETADIAMKHLKSSKNGQYIAYDPAMKLRETIKDNLAKIVILKDALANHRILPYFQPIVNLRGQNIPKYESLARIVHQGKEVESISPYIHLLDETHLSGTLLRQMMTQTLATMQKHPGVFSINISSRDLEDKPTVDWIFEQLEGMGEDSSRLVFELLEHDIIDDYQGVGRFITQLYPYGCKIAIDDFGSGYSNFSHLLHLSIDYLKIDASLIRPLATDPFARDVVGAIVAFARAAHIQTIAEFVSTKEIYDIVVELGIDYSQGYYSGKPEPLG